MAPDPSKHTKICQLLATVAIAGLSAWCVRDMFFETINIVDGKRAEMPKASKVSLAKPHRTLTALLGKQYGIAAPDLKITGSFLEVTTTEDVAKQIIDDAYDFDFSLRELHIEKLICRVRGSQQVFTYVVTPNFLGLGVTPDLVLCEMLEGFGAASKENQWFKLRELLLNEAEKHVNRYLKSDPSNPVLLLNQGILREKSGENDPYRGLMQVSTREAGRAVDRTKVNRARLASELVDAIECKPGLNTEEQLVESVRNNIPKDYFQSYLISRISAKFNDKKGEAAARADFDEERERTYRLFATMLFALSASTTMFLLTCFARRKLWKLPTPENLPCCPNPYGFKPIGIIAISSAITCVLIVILWIQCPPLVIAGGVPLVSVFSPDKVALLELLHQLATTVPFITLTFLFAHRDLPFAEFVRLRFQSNGYSPKELFALGIAGFSICWMIANISMLLSMWFHYPGDTAVTVGTGLIAGSHSPLAIMFLFTGTAIFAPITEEIIFRGILNPALRRNLDAKTVMVLGALIFAVAHLEFTPWWFVHKFFLGYMNSYLLEKTGSIVPGIINHMLINGFVVLFLCVCA